MEELDSLKGLASRGLPTRDLVSFLTRYFGHQVKKDEDYEFATEPFSGGFVASLKVQVWSSQVYWGRWARTEEAAREEVAKEFLLQPEVYQAAANLPPSTYSVRDFFFFRLRQTGLYDDMPQAEYKVIVDEYTHDYISWCLENGCSNAFTDGRA
eukprot:Skav219528  [mRNA]  locus=scaffold30:519056:519517:- [translate_table: standard]